MKTNEKFFLAGIATVIAIIIAFGISKVDVPQNTGGASGIPATQRVATTTEVGPDETVTIFSASSCSSRVISTTDGTGTVVNFLTGDPTNGDLASTTLSSVNGHLHAASTTTVYDAEVYGCGRWTATAVSSTTITTAELR